MTRPVADWAGNILAFALVIVFNVMATALPLGGQTPPEISARYPSLFTPAGITFSVWGIIYLGLTCFVIYQALPSQRQNESLAGISLLFKLNCVANAAWLLAWHYDFLLLSLLIMAGILATLIGIYAKLDVHRAAAEPAQRLLANLPFSLYTAWICVASIANLSIVQTAVGWNDLGTDAVTWTLLKLALAGTIGTIMVARKGDIAFVLVIGWAAYGISVKQVATPAVAGAALTLALLAIMLSIVQAVNRLRSDAA